VVAEDILNGRGPDIFSSGHDHVSDPTINMEPAGSVEVPGITGCKPAISVERHAPVPVGAKKGRPSEEHLVGW
jgi:hypothetical protein